MKKFLLLITASVLLISGCNNSELDNRPASEPLSSGIGTQINGQSSAEITVSGAMKSIIIFPTACRQIRADLRE